MPSQILIHLPLSHSHYNPHPSPPPPAPLQRTVASAPPTNHTSKPKTATSLRYPKRKKSKKSSPKPPPSPNPRRRIFYHLCRRAQLAYLAPLLRPIRRRNKITSKFPPPISQLSIGIGLILIQKIDFGKRQYMYFNKIAIVLDTPLPNRSCTLRTTLSRYADLLNAPKKSVLKLSLNLIEDTSYTLLIFKSISYPDAFCFSISSQPYNKEKLCKQVLSTTILSTVSILLDAITYVISGFLGIKIITYANARTILEAKKSVVKAFITAFRSCAVMGFLITANALLVLNTTINLFKL